LREYSDVAVFIVENRVSLSGESVVVAFYVFIRTIQGLLSTIMKDSIFWTFGKKKSGEG